MKSKVKLPLMSNRSGAPGDDWFHLVPKGEFPHADSGMLQVIDGDAVTSIVNRFEAESKAPDFRGLLVDQDHFSYDPEKSSEAYGWIRELQNRDNGVWGRIEWTSLGQSAIAEKRYKSVSPCWLPRDVETLGNRRVRPLRLDSAGLTNIPNLQGMVPLANRGAGEDAAKGMPESDSVAPIAKAVGLPAKATVAKVLEVVAEMQARLAETQSLLKALEDKVAEEDLAPVKNSLPPQTLAHLKEQLIANRAAMLPVVRSLSQKPAVRPSITNRATAGNPEFVWTDAGHKRRFNEAKAAIEKYMNDHRCSFKEAYASVRRARPDLLPSHP